MVRIQTDEWCAARHRPTVWAVGLLFVFTAVLVIMVGWSCWAATASANEATRAIQHSELLEVSVTESRTSLRDDMAELKASIKMLVEKQEKMNEHIQRLLQGQVQVRKE